MALLFNPPICLPFRTCTLIFRLKAVVPTVTRSYTLDSLIRVFWLELSSQHVFTHFDDAVSGPRFTPIFW
jgi:hypothetical protein